MCDQLNHSFEFPIVAESPGESVTGLGPYALPETATAQDGEMVVELHKAKIQMLSIQGDKPEKIHDDIQEEQARLMKGYTKKIKKSRNTIEDMSVLLFKQPCIDSLHAAELKQHLAEKERELDAQQKIERTLMLDNDAKKDRIKVLEREPQKRLQNVDQLQKELCKATKKAQDANIEGQCITSKQCEESQMKENELKQLRGKQSFEEPADQCFVPGQKSREELDIEEILKTKDAKIENLQFIIKEQERELQTVTFSNEEGKAAISHRVPFPDITEDLRQLRTKFGSTFYNVRLLFSNKWAKSQKDINKVKALLTDIFPDLKSELSVAKTIDDVLEVVKGKCSIIDVRPLEVIAVHFKVKEAEDIIREHKEAAKEFYKSVSLCLSEIELFQLQAIPTLCRIITFVLNWNSDETILKDINDILLELDLLRNYYIKVVATEKINQSTVNDCEEKELPLRQVQQASPNLGDTKKLSMNLDAKDPEKAVSIKKDDDSGIQELHVDGLTIIHEKEEGTPLTQELDQATKEELESLLADKVDTLVQAIGLNEKLKTYQRISTMKDREIEDLRTRLKKGGQDTSTSLSKSQLQKIKRLKFELEDSHKTIDSKVESLQEKLVKTNEELKVLKKLLLSDKTMEKLQILSEYLQEENKQLEAAVAQKEEELIAAKREIASFKEVAESRNKEIKELKQRHETEVLVLNEQASQTKKELSSINNELKQSEESNEELKKELQAVRTMSRAKDAEIDKLIKENKACVHSGPAKYSSGSSTQECKALPISKEPLSITESIEEETALNQCQDLELSKKKFKTEAPSTAAIGFLYTTFIVLLVAIYWQPDPSIFISSLPGVEVIASHKFLVAGGQSSQLHWDEYGLMLDIPNDALPCGFVAEVVIRVSVSGPYVYPDLKTWKPASAVYWISSSKEFVNPVLLGIWHNVKGSVNSSSIKVLTAEDTPQNMSYIFNEFLGDFTVKGSYVYFKLTGFSGKKVVTSLDVRNFQGSLFYKMSEAGNKWKYSLVIYNSHVKGVTRSLFDGTQYEDWILDIKFDVIFEENSKILELNITPDPPLENWIIRRRINPLSYRKDALQSQEHIVSNMRFDIHWNGSSDLLTDDYLNFPLKGAEYPLSITANPSRIDHKTSANINFTKKKRGIKLDIKDLNDIDLILKSSSFDNSKWSDLGLKLGLFQTRLNTIKSDNSQDAKACLGETLGKWLNRVDEVDKNGGATWEALMDALEKIEQKPVAEKIKDYID